MEIGGWEVWDDSALLTPVPGRDILSIKSVLLKIVKQGRSFGDIHAIFCGIYLGMEAS